MRNSQDRYVSLFDGSTKLIPHTSRRMVTDRKHAIRLTDTVVYVVSVYRFYRRSRITDEIKNFEMITELILEIRYLLEKRFFLIRCEIVDCTSDIEFLLMRFHGYNDTMHCFIIAALTADGHIAKDEHHSAFWTSKEDKKRFVELTKRAGVIVMGSNTYQTLPRPLKERINIVYSKSKTFEGAEVTQKSPQELLQELESRGFKEVAICGGSQIYTMFMKAGVVDRLYLTVEPLIFGKGLSLFSEEINRQLTLVSAVHNEGGSLFLEYKVNSHS